MPAADGHSVQPQRSSSAAKAQLQPRAAAARQQPAAAAGTVAWPLPAGPWPGRHLTSQHSIASWIQTWKKLAFLCLLGIRSNFHHQQQARVAWPRPAAAWAGRGPAVLSSARPRAATQEPRPAESSSSRMRSHAFRISDTPHRGRTLPTRAGPNRAGPCCDDVNGHPAPGAQVNLATTKRHTRRSWGHRHRKAVAKSNQGARITVVRMRP